MPCTKCNSDFNFFNWKIRCGECQGKYCTKCLKKREGVLFCEKCMILLKRPPDRGKLMELKPKDLQDYLKKHNISTHGLVEKQELVDLFCNKHIPVKQRKGTEKLTANFGCSLPNFRDNSTLGELWDSLGNESFWTSSSNGQQRTSQEPPRPPPRRRSPRNSPTSPTTPQSRFSPQPTGQSSASSTPPEDRHQPPSTSTGNTLEPDWVFVNTAGSSEDISHQKTPEGSPVPPKCPKLAELESEEDLNQLSAKQLKILLTVNRVDFRGCVEKKELLDKAITLWRDNKKQREGDNICSLINIIIIFSGIK
ncbi:hypothetical protein HHI36_008552 [Cryptolaemus montrouzieri]|uniref:Uncharacterized protein n=1 Tax=Cryptolaemus montrouzieri TaxID=559131 RepID=A0ABD2MSV4_9CUCU